MPGLVPPLGLGSTVIDHGLCTVCICVHTWAIVCGVVLMLMLKKYVFFFFYSRSTLGS